MSVRTFSLAALAAMVGNWLDRTVRKFLRPILIALAVPAFYLWSQAVLLTGDVRTGTALLVLGVLALVVLAVYGKRWAVGLWAAHHRRDQPSPAAGGPDPECLYRWWEPTDLPYGSRCSCGKPRMPGELVYIGITNDMARRSRDDDRRAACWWHVGLVGTVETYGDRRAMEVAERRAIDLENPRENIAHAGRR